MMASLGKISTIGRSVPSMASACLGPLSFLSSASAPAVASKKQPSPPGNNNYGRCISPTTILPPSPDIRHVAENLVWRAALQDLQKKQKEEINGLERMLDSLRIARIPDSGKPTSSVAVPQQQTQHTFQVMNRNARKPKRANHGKRPCSRIRRRYKVKKWANTSRKG